MQENGGRRPRFHRVAFRTPPRLTERDQAIFQVVRCYRFLTTSHICALVGGSRQNVTRRLQRLYHAGFLDRPRVQMPLRYAGQLHEIVYSESTSSEKVSPLFLAHALSISDVLVAIAGGCQKFGLRFISEREILASAGLEKPIKHLRWRVTVRSNSAPQCIGVVPDAVFALEKPDTSQRRYFLLEADRGTMPIYRKHLRSSSIHRKALAYHQTRRTKILERKFGFPGFQVLVVTYSKKRTERMREVCGTVLNGRFPALFLFITFEGLSNADPFSIAWKTCGEALTHFPLFRVFES